MILISLALQSLRNRALSTAITLFSVALSVFLILGVEQVRRGTQESFSNSISQVDIVVGARGSEIQLLLYSIFHLGDATNNITYDTYEHFKNHPSTEWTIPISLGDSHEGYRVVATDHNFYEHYRFQEDRAVEFRAGRAADDVFDVVLGSEVAKKLKYEIGTPVVISHGISAMSFQKHADKPFKIVGILKATGTPVDRALYITLEGMEAIHIDWKDGTPPLPGQGTPASQIKKDNIKIGQITSFLLRTRNRIAILRLQREINDFTSEPLMSTIPGVALSKLWDTLSYAEIALRMISACVALVSLLGLLLVLYTSLNERRREMSIFRALGLGPAKLLFLLLSESISIVIVGALLGAGALYAALWLGGPWLIDTFGLVIPVHAPSSDEWGYLGILVLASFFVGLIPAWTAYRRSLADGLGVRI